MGASRKLVGAAFGALIATALSFGAAQASTSPASAVVRVGCTGAEWQECYDYCLAHWGEGTQSSCSKLGSRPECTCYP